MQEYMENVCRTCLRSPEALLPLFDETHLSEKIETISSVQLSEADNLPAKICAECITNINLSYNFRRVIINSDLDLKRRLSTFLSQVEIINSEEDELQAVQIEIKSESEILTEEHYLVETISDVLENIEDENIEIEMKTEEMEKTEKENDIETEMETKELEQTEKENDIKIIQVAEASRLKVSLDDFPKTILYKSQSRLRGIQPGNHLFKCNECDFATTDYSKYSRHNRNRHRKSQSICNICGKTIRTDNLKKHISIHTESPVPCQECGKMCKNSETLRSHLLVHNGLHITCEVCGQILKCRRSYRRHVQKKHTVEASRKVKCHLCEKTFYCNTDLKKHLRSHTGERPYLCEYCLKGFSSSNALKTHVRQHTNERPYACEFCPMAFPQKVSLRTHLKSKHSVLLESTC